MLFTECIHGFDINVQTPTSKQNFGIEGDWVIKVLLTMQLNITHACQNIFLRRDRFVIVLHANHSNQNPFLTKQTGKLKNSFAIKAIII